MYCAHGDTAGLFIELMIQLGGHFSVSGVKIHAN